MPNKIQLYSLATPNGQKIGIALEEMGIEYDAHKIDISNGAQFTPEFVKINPNSKIPAIVDPVGDNGAPLSIMESGAILMYLAEKSGQFLPQDPVKRIETLQWLFFQVGGPGPLFGQFGHFYKQKDNDANTNYPLERYATETKRLLKVIDNQLINKKWIIGEEITIADFALAPWVDCLDVFFKASDYLELNEYKNINRWLKAFLDRPAVISGRKVCSNN
ncbi:MAG: glutathione S-transferase [Bdellovibrionaceae bacterium]|jgi:GSH-dependent disulfide-bond oxidoreductase|nr:glutathione S-transferase [Pseudobdellovibrionaceae bacterium]